MGITRGLPAGVLAPNLGLQITRLAAGTAIVCAVFTKADLIEALAQRAVLVAGAVPLGLVADHAHEFFGHSGRLSRFLLSGNGTMVDGLAIEIASGARRSRKKSRGLAGFIDPAKLGC
jgi:hypothetical protein